MKKLLSGYEWSLFAVTIYGAVGVLRKHKEQHAPREEEAWDEHGEVEPPVSQKQQNGTNEEQGSTKQLGQGSNCCGGKKGDKTFLNIGGQRQSESPANDPYHHHQHHHYHELTSILNNWDKTKEPPNYYKVKHLNTNIISNKYQTLMSDLWNTLHKIAWWKCQEWLTEFGTTVFFCIYEVTAIGHCWGIQSAIGAIVGHHNSDHSSNTWIGHQPHIQLLCCVIVFSNIHLIRKQPSYVIFTMVQWRW